MTSRKTITGDPLHRVFHENSKNFEFNDSEGAIPDSWTEIEYKSYPAAETIPFQPTDDHTESIPLRDAIASRRSTTNAAGAITLRAIQDFLQSGAGITEREESPDNHRRAYPSGGARYPLETYVSVFDGVNVPKALYHYNVLDDVLEVVRDHASNNDLTFVRNEMAIDAAAALFLTARFERTTVKYGERGYRYALMEAGHLAQNVCLLAASMDVACRPIGGFLEGEADSYLELPESETTVYVLLLGGDQNE